MFSSYFANTIIIIIIQKWVEFDRPGERSP